MPRIYRTRKFLTVPTSTRHLSLRLRDTSSKNTPPRKSEWGSSLPPDCFMSRESISTWLILNIRFFFFFVIVSTSPNPQAVVLTLVGCPRMLIQFIHSYPPYRKPFLHPQPEDAPCRGDRYPHSWYHMLYVI
jgi:hypothetical protein